MAEFGDEEISVDVTDMTIAELLLEVDKLPGTRAEKMGNLIVTWEYGGRASCGCCDDPPRIVLTRKPEPVNPELFRLKQRQEARENLELWNDQNPEQLDPINQAKFDEAYEQGKRIT